MFKIPHCGSARYMFHNSKSLYSAMIKIDVYIERPIVDTSTICHGVN